MVLSDLASAVRVAPYITEDSTALVSRNEGTQNSSSSSKETAVAEVVAQPSIVTGKVPLFAKFQSVFWMLSACTSHSFSPMLKVKAGVLKNFDTGLDSVLDLNYNYQLCQNSNNIS
jgi:hypothetical protein